MSLSVSFRRSARAEFVEAAAWYESERQNTSIAIDPNGQFAYLTESNGVYVYSINTTTGALTATGSSVPLSSPQGTLQIDPSGQFAYIIADTGASGLGTGVYAFMITAGAGALVPVSGNPFASGTGIGAPVRITLSP